MSNKPVLAKRKETTTTTKQTKETPQKIKFLFGKCSPSSKFSGRVLVKFS